MKMIALLVSILFGLILSFYPANINTGVIIFLSLNLYFLFRYFTPIEQNNGSKFAFLPVKAAYTTTEDRGCLYKYVWLCKVDFKYYDDRRVYNTSSLWNNKS